MNAGSLVKSLRSTFSIKIRLILYKIKLAEYLIIDRKVAKELLRKIESRKGKISKKLRKQCNDYAKENLGGIHFAPWLYVYTAINGEFREGWIPDNFYANKVVPHIKGNTSKISNYKSVQCFLFGPGVFPDSFSYINGRVFDMNLTEIDQGNIMSRMFRNSQRIVFKQDDSNQGLGVYVFDRKSLEAVDLSKLGDGVFQCFIEQHVLFERLCPGNVATLRVTSVIEGGKVDIVGCNLRLGRSGETHVQSSSAIKIPVDIDSGSLAKSGYTTDFREVEVHPDSKQEFGGLEVPVFHEIIEKVILFHRKVPFIGCVGWDIAIDSLSRVILLEWEGTHNDVKFIEAVQGPVFRKYGWEKYGHSKK